MLFLVFAMANTVVYAQSKKQQNITLNNRVDSFRLALSSEIKLSNENSIELNNRIDSLYDNLSSLNSMLKNYSDSLVYFKNYSYSAYNKIVELDNELKKKELIIDSLRAESNNTTKGSDFRFNLIEISQQESPTPKWEYISDYKIELLYGNSVVATFDDFGKGYLSDEKDAVYIATDAGSRRTYFLKSNTIDEVSITQNFFLGSASIDRDVWTKTYKNYSHWELMRCEGDCE
tara:strand:- start:1969 stop:2664 length:696 start_codon:yes stop_codon:yes gene_type:complete